MTMIAYACLQSRRLAEAGGKIRIPYGPPQPSLPAIRRAVVAILARAPPHRCPHAGAPSAEPSNKSAKVVLECLCHRYNADRQPNVGAPCE